MKPHVSDLRRTQGTFLDTRVLPRQAVAADQVPSGMGVPALLY